VIEKKMIRTKNKARSFVQVRRSRSKSGVSPVIGVILMVAATIVIAGVVMAMLGGFSAPKTGYIVTAKASQSPSSNLITVLYNGGPDHSLVNGSADLDVRQDNTTSSSTANMLPTVGNTTTLAGTVGANNDHVTVVVTFKDGTKQVILDTWV
jgi:flagellin-like protein